MPSNQPPRPLTKPHYRAKSAGQAFLISASPYVLRANRALTFFSACFLAVTFLFTLRSGEEIESYARGGTARIGKYAGSHWPTSDKTKCNPFKQQGWIENSSSAGQVPVWRTFSRECAGLNPLSLLATSAASAAPSLAHLRNQTVLIVGDAQPTQKRLSDLCQLIPESRRGDVGVSHPWGGILQNAKAQDPQNNGLGSYCYVPALDLLIHHFPVASTLTTSPVSVESRMQSLLPNLLTSWTSSSLSTPSIPLPRSSAVPALTIWASSYDSDMHTWPTNGFNGNLIVSEDALNQWRTRNVDALAVLDGILAGASRSQRRAKPVIEWQSPGFGDILSAIKKEKNPTSDVLLNTASTIPNAHTTTAPLYSAMQSLFKPQRSRSDPLFAKQSHELSSSVKGELEWRRVSEGLNEESTAVAIWGEMVLASLSEVAV